MKLTLPASAVIPLVSLHRLLLLPLLLPKVLGLMLLGLLAMLHMLPPSVMLPTLWALWVPQVHLACLEAVTGVMFDEVALAIPVE